MAALLAILTFAVFVALDYFLSRRATAAAPAAEARPTPPPPIAEPVFVAGYQMPASVHYHPGHTWVRPLGPDTVLVGMDDFARRLVGRPDRITLPAVGSWMLQGAKGFRVESEGRSAALVAPVEGEVVEVNRDLRKDPASLPEDPYGRGWFCKVRSANLAANLRNLLSGNVARRWMEEAKERLELELMALSGSVLQDGGEPAPDFAHHLQPDEWRHLAEEFLLA
jgi:glycine cleavage system H lipoate-binding protein